MVTTTILAKVEKGRLQKAVKGLVSGAYTITLASQTEAEIRGFVANGDGKEYGVVLTEGQPFCSCPDSMYRKGICSTRWRWLCMRSAHLRLTRKKKRGQ